MESKLFTKVIIAIFILILYQNCKAEDVLILKLDLLEARYNLQKNDINRTKLLEAYHDFIEDRCQPAEGGPLAESELAHKVECETYAKRTLDISPNDKLAVCALDGKRSSSCLEAQGLKPTKAGSIREKIDKFLSAPDPTLSPTPPQTLEEYIIFLSKRYQSSKDPQIKSKLQLAILAAIKKYCPSIPPARIGNEQDETDESPSQQNEGPLSGNCTNYISQLNGIDATNPYIECYKQGVHSNACDPLRENSGPVIDDAGFKSF